MTDEAETPAAPAAPPSPKSSKVMPLLLFLNLAATGAGTFLQLRHKDGVAAAEAAAAPVPKEPEAPKPGPVAPLEPFVVNLNEPGLSRYLKATFELELSSPKAIEELEKGRRVVRDEILRYLSGLSVADTLGTQNKEKIQSEIVSRADKALGGGKVKRVFFIDFVVQ
jgi:flagellar protein FliL